jgi:flagellar biosynthesis protein
VVKEAQRYTAQDPADPAARGEVDLAAALASRSGRARDARLIAKAKGPLAAEILQLAEANGIAIHADADLAEILVALEEDSEIPLGALAAVAEILNHFYQRRDPTPDQSPELTP